MHRKDELSKLARIRVDVPNALDHLWTLDIRKSTAVPPDVIKSNLARIVDRISEGSKRAWTFRGKREISDNGSHLWSKTKIRDGVVYNLNREHVLLQLLEETLNQEQKKLLENYLRLAEGNLPLNQLYVDLNNEEQVNVRKEKDAEREAIETVETILANISDSPHAGCTDTSHNADGSVLQLQKHRRYAGKGVGFLIWQIWHCSKNLSVRRSVLLLSTELPRKKNLQQHAIWFV